MLRTFLKILHGCVAVLLLLSLGSPYVNPDWFWPFAFLGLAFPFLFLANVFFLLLWAFRRDILFIHALVVVLICSGEVGHFYHWHDREIPSEGQGSKIKVISYNVRLFDFYNWTNRKETKDQMLDLLGKEKASIVCLQEFFTQDTGRHITRNELQERLTASPNAHIVYTSFTKKQLQRFGIATYSAYPIVRRGKILLEVKSQNTCIYTDLLIENDTVRVYNMHLQSVHLLAEDYRFLSQFGSEENNENIKDTRRIASKLKKAFMIRAEQARIIKKHMSACPYPVIVCGDFNDVPISYAYHMLSKDLSDSYLEEGGGWGATYEGVFPGARIDYILHDDHLRTTRFRVMRKKYSDHYPIVAEFSFSNTN